MASQRKVTAGVDVGGTKIQTVVLRGHEVAGQCRVLTPQTGASRDVIAAIAETIRSSLDAAGAATAGLRGVGIGIPGAIDLAAGAVSHAANVPGFSERVELARLVSEELDGVEVTVENDVTVGVLGEFRRGAGRPYRNLMGVWVGTGVGGGLILDGQLHDGRGSAGEIGHVVVRPGGRRCSCGRRGCLEAYAGRVSMERRARRLAAHGKHTVLFDIMEERGRDRLSSGVYARALKKHDRMTRDLLGDAVAALGIGIASVQNVLDLEAIIIGGGLGDRLGPPFVERVVEAMGPHLFADDRPPAVLPTELGDLAGAVGAGVLAGG